MLTKTPIRTVFHRQPATQPRRARLADAAMQAGAIELMGARMSFTANAEIYGENEPADYLYKVVSGAVRTYKVLVDGRRQIEAFHLPGDIFGFETGDEHAFSAEAITDCKITVIKRRSSGVCCEDNEVARQMWALSNASRSIRCLSRVRRSGARAFSSRWRAAGYALRARMRF